MQAAIAMVACSNDSGTAPAPTPQVRVYDFATNTVVRSADFPLAGGRREVNIDHNIAISVTSSEPDWCHVVAVNATKSRSLYAIEVDANQYTPRTATVLVSGVDTEYSHQITVSQDGTNIPAPEPIVPPESIGMTRTAMELASQMYAGINIGNTLEAPGGETSWGNPRINEQYIKGLKAMGFNAVRIPCAWDSHIIDRASNTIDPLWLHRVAEVVSYCLSNDMFAFVNVHWDGGWLEEHITDGYNAELDAKQHRIWSQIAEALNMFDERLLFAGCNEPGYQDQSGVGADALEALLAYEQTFINAVRATGGNNALRCLIVQGPWTNIDKTTTVYTMPTDWVEGRLFVEVHFYDPYQFCMMQNDEYWSNVFWYWGAPNHVDGSAHNANFGEEDYVASQFAKMKASYVDKGIPVIVGEYSTQIQTAENRSDKNEEFLTEVHKASRAYWNEVVTREAKNNGCVPFYWETGGEINRYDGSVRNQYAIDGIMRGALAGKYPY